MQHLLRLALSMPALATDERRRVVDFLADRQGGQAEALRWPMFQDAYQQLCEGVGAEGAVCPRSYVQDLSLDMVTHIAAFGPMRDSSQPEVLIV